jgi:predicted RNA-binding protein with PUA-like domain
MVTIKHWLLKSEPCVFSWQQLVKAGDKGTHWDGVRNHLAKQNLMAMKKGDQAFFYHSNEGKEMAGIMEVIREAYPDPSAEPGEPWVVVDVKALKPLPAPVTLAQVKAEKKLARMSLVTSARLSVQPVTADEWALICKMAGLK